MYRYNFLLIKTVVFIVFHNIVCVYGESLRSINIDKDNLQQNLDADEDLVLSLAYDICSNLQVYHDIYNKSIPFSEQDCQNNFMNSTKYNDKIPPQAQERRKHKSKIVYDIAPINDPDVWRLVVLTPVNTAEGEYFQLPYDLLENNAKDVSTVDISPGEYQAWTTLIAMDGNHSPWLGGPSVHSGNHKDAKKNDDYLQNHTEDLNNLDYSGHQTKEILDDSDNSSEEMQNLVHLTNQTEEMNNLLISLNHTEDMKNLDYSGHQTTDVLDYLDNYTEEIHNLVHLTNHTEEMNNLLISLNHTEDMKNLDNSEHPTTDILTDNYTEEIQNLVHLTNQTEEMNNLLISLNHTEEIKNLVHPRNHTDEMNNLVHPLNDTKGMKNLVHSLNHTEEMKNIHTVNHTNETMNLVIPLNHSEEMKNLMPLWNHKEGLMKDKSYGLKVKTMEHQIVNESSAVIALVSWEPLDVEDGHIELRNFCDGKDTKSKILPNDSTSWAVSGLPLGKDCEVLLVGKCGMEKISYRTPDCGDLSACIDYEKAQDLVLRADPSAHGWDVFVSWSYRHQPFFFNVTFLSANDTRHELVPGNVTEVTFEDVVGNVEEIYDVAVDAVLENRTVHTSSRAQFMEEGSWYKLSQALGGAWGALICAGIACAAIVLLWRRRRENKLKHIYFPHELLDKPCKESSNALDTEAPTRKDPWELKSEKLLLHEVIGEGAFGVVRRGTLEPAGKDVAVKMLKDFPTLDEIRSFRAEMELMKSVGAHPHVVSLVGCCSGRRPFIVAEYCSRGDLLSYLRCSWDVMVSKRNAKYYNNNIENADYRNDLFKCQPQEEYSKLVVNKLYDLQGVCDTELTTRDLLSFCRQIAMGMEFLASNRLVHRDLAARNVLVSSDRTLKIADFGLSRDVYEENLYKQKGNGKMPMKWMALESLTKRIYTSQSDVWSFGVVMWEVVSVGASPYPDMPPARLPRLLRAGYRMPRPHNCSPQLYEVMLSCWRAHPRDRPTFARLHAQLDELLNCACKHDYLSLEPDAEEPLPPVSTHKYVKMYIRNKLGWSREEPYERPLRTAQSNHYSTPPASAYKLQPIT